MLDDELNQLLHQWSQQARLRDEEMTKMLTDILPAPSADPSANLAAPWIAFWQQIGRLIRAEQYLATIAFLPPPTTAPI